MCVRVRARGRERASSLYHKRGWTQPSIGTLLGVQFKDSKQIRWLLLSLMTPFASDSTSRNLYYMYVFAISCLVRRAKLKQMESQFLLRALPVRIKVPVQEIPVMLTYNSLFFIFRSAFHTPQLCRLRESGIVVQGICCSSQQAEAWSTDDPALWQATAPVQPKTLWSASDLSLSWATEVFLHS